MDIKQSIPKELKKCVEEDKLVVFVGAGLSSKLKNISGNELGNWNNLVSAILDFLEKEEYDVAKSLKALVGQYEPIEILRLIELYEGFPDGKIVSFVKDYFKLDKSNDYGLHEKISNLSNIIITTNYDTAFEEAVPDLKDNKAYKGRDHEILSLQEDNKPKLFKLHGCREDANSMILFPSNYRDLYESNSPQALHALYVLGNLFYGKKLLFIGTRLGDYQINSIFRKIKEFQGSTRKKHFIITTNDISNELKGLLTPIKIDSYSQIPMVIDELLRIRNSKKAKLNEIPFKDSEGYIKQLDKKQDKSRCLLEEEAKDHFKRGTEFRLNEDLQNAILHYKRATQLAPTFAVAYQHWGAAILKNTLTKPTVTALTEAIDKCNKAINLDLRVGSVYLVRGMAYSLLSTLKSTAETDLKEKAVDDFNAYVEIEHKYYVPSCYCAYAEWKPEALRLLEKSLLEKEVTIDRVETDKRWGKFHDDQDFKDLISKYNKEGAA